MTDEAKSDPEQTPFEVTDVLGGAKLEHGTGIYLSGGGFRAMLFHFGSLIRLNEFGLLPTIDRVSSVSVGSLAAGILAASWPKLDFDANSVAKGFDARVSEPLLRLARKRVDVPAILLGCIPFVHAANGAARTYDRTVFDSKTLQELPDRPRFCLHLDQAVLWRFAKEYAADWRVGKWSDMGLKLALAVAASAGFPPLLSPARIKPPKGAIKSWGEPTTLSEPGFAKRLFLTDGGVYDNLGIEPVWKRYWTLLVSDRGAVTQPIARPFANWYSQFRRALDVSLQQGINTRIRILHGLDRSQARTVAYWGIGTMVDSYGKGNPLAFSAEMTARAAIVPTLLTKFSAETRRLLVRAGYAHTEAALTASRVRIPNPCDPTFERLPVLDERCSMPFAEQNTAYENWMRTVCDVVEADLDRKHDRMSKNAFRFLRATFFRWAHSVKSTAPEIMELPAPLAVGDVHVENFGTWRDAEMRLVWGVNDHDDAAEIPYASDILRLAVSVRLADFSIGGRDAAQAIFEGYGEGLHDPGPTLLDQTEIWMRDYVAVTDEQRNSFWDEIDGYPDASPSSDARSALLSSLPADADFERFARASKGEAAWGDRVSSRSRAGGAVASLARRRRCCPRDGNGRSEMPAGRAD